MKLIKSAYLVILISVCSCVTLKPVPLPGGEKIQNDLKEMSAQSINVLTKMLKKRSYIDLTQTQELPKMPETAKVELELTTSQTEQAASGRQALPAVAAVGATAHASSSNSDRERNKRKADETTKTVEKRVEFLSPPMPPIPPQVAELVDEVDMTDINGVKDTIETKLNKLYTYGNQYRNFALEFLSQYLSLLGEFGMQFKDLGLNVVKSIGVSAPMEGKQQ